MLERDAEIERFINALGMELSGEPTTFCELYGPGRFANDPKAKALGLPPWLVFDLRTGWNLADPREGPEDVATS